MNANATPDSPVHDLADRDRDRDEHDAEQNVPADPADSPTPAASADPAGASSDEDAPADDAQESAEPAWIEVGSPKRRTTPPAWSDEARGDAWAQSRSDDEPAQRPAALQVELMDDPADGHAAATDVAATGVSATDATSDLEAVADPDTVADPDAAAGPDTASESEESIVEPGSPVLRGVRLRRPPRVAHNRPFRKPALRDSPRTPQLDSNGPADAWVQGPTDEELAAAPDPSSPPAATAPVPATDEHPAACAEGEARREMDAQTAELLALDGTEGELSENDVAEQQEQTSEETAELVALDAAGPEDLTGQTVPEAEEGLTEPAPLGPAADDPESGDRWQVVTENGPDPANPADPTADEAEPTGDDTAGPESGERLETAAPAPAPQTDAAPAPEPDTESDMEADTEPADMETEQPPPAAVEQPPSGAREGAGTLAGALDVVAGHLRPHRSALIVGLSALVVSIWLLVALPFPLKYSVDAAIAAAGAESPAVTGVGSDPATSLGIAAGVLAVMVALQAGFRALSVSVLNRAGSRVATDLRSRLLSHLHRLSPGRDIDLDRLDETSRPLIDDVSRLRDLVAHSGPRIAAGLLALASLLVVVLIVEPMAALIVLVTGGLYALVARVALRLVRTREAAARTAEAALADTADELLAATGTVQSYGLEERAERGLAEVGARAGRSRAAARRTRAIRDFLAELVAGLGVTAALLLGGWRMSAGTMSPGELTLVIAYVLIAVVLIREVVRHSGTVKATVAAGDRVGDLLAHRAGVTDPQRTQPLDRVRGEIVFSALNAPGPRGPLFDTVSLVVPAGQHVAVLDREGTETHALISYLLRFDQPETGRVLLDRYDTRAVPLADLRRQIAVVQREPALFTDTVRENIRVGRPDAGDDEVVRAARQVGADEFIALLPEGYDTQLLRRGERLSDGQRRRIAIARALLRDAPIVVLDGADAEIAPAERDAVRRGLAALVRGRTALIHSRDPDSILTTDRVLWFEGGDLTEDGAPGQLAEDPDSWLSSWIHAAEETGR